MVPAAFTGRSVDELQAAVRAANWAIRERAVAQPGLEGMGTTVCAAGLLISGDVALVNVGDSRAYLFREGSLTHLTQDHSLTAELIERENYGKRRQLSIPITGFSPGHSASGPMSRSTRQRSLSKKGTGSLFVVMDCSTSSPTKRSKGPWRETKTWPRSSNVDRQGHCRWRSRQHIRRDRRSGCLRDSDWVTQLRVGIPAFAFGSSRPA